MKCDNFLLEGYVDCFLNIAERREVEKHLQHCEKCQAEVKRLQQEQLQIVRDLNAPKLQKSFADDIMNAIETKPVTKMKKRWQIPLTMTATAMLAIGLVGLNKDTIFEQADAPVDVVQEKGKIIFEDINVSTGQIEISLFIADEKGKVMKPKSLANVKVFAQNRIDISDSVDILVSSNNDHYHYTIELEHMEYDELNVQFEFEEEDLLDSVDVDLTNVVTETMINDINVTMQGRRLKNGVHEIFYRTGFNEDLLNEYKQLEKQLKGKFGDEHTLFYKTNISYELFDADGLMLVGERSDASWEGSGIGSSGGGGNELGEMMMTLKVPKRYGNFPMTMRVTHISNSYPVDEAIPVTLGEQKEFEFEGGTYSVLAVKENGNSVAITIEGKSLMSTLASLMYAKIGGSYYLGDYISSNGDGIFTYTTNINNLQVVPDSIELVIVSVQREVELAKPVEIVIE
ncbi:MAG: zf-HC2 domain-containing protein [Lysinibacillus sp.]